MIYIIGLSMFITFTSILLLTFSNSVVLDYLATILLAPAISMIFGINLYTWYEGQPDALTFNKMVRRDLDAMFL